MDNYELLVSKLNQAKFLKDDHIKHTNKELSDTLVNLQIIADKLNSNFHDTRDNLKKQAEEKQQVRDTFKDQRKEREIVATTTSNKILELKQEIETKALENQLMEAQLRDQSPPLILKLMGSSSSNAGTGKVVK